MLECSGGRFSVARWTSSEAVDLGREPVAPAVILERWAEIEGGVAMKSRRPPSIIESFNFAFEGIIHVLRTQRNMRIHFAVAALVLIAALVSGVDKLELIALLLAIAFVLIAEMLNTAVEAAIDVATTSFDPMAKLAKDIAAGAVLIATAVAVAVGYLVFSGQVADRSSRLLDRLSTVPAELTLVALVLTTLVVIATKAFTGSGTPLRGGLPSGHAAVAFAGWMAVTLILDDVDHRFLISSVTFIMALLVAQTRVESGVHSSAEVLYGGLIGALVALVVFQVAQIEERAGRESRGGRRARLRAVLELQRRGGRADGRRPRVRGRQRRERRLPARRLRREERARRCGRRRATARAGSRRSGSTLLPAAAAGSGWPSSGSRR